MAQFYANNADSVSDFMKNYSDQQIEGMEDMTDSVANQADLAWKDGAERTRALAEGKAEEGGEILGSLIGVKGLGKGIGKLRDLYKRGKALKEAIEKRKAQGDDDDDLKGFEDEDEGTENLEDEATGEDDLSGFSKEDFVNTGEGDADTFQTAPFQGEDDFPETSENLGDNLADADEGAETSVDTATETLPEATESGVGDLSSLTGDSADFANTLTSFRGGFLQRLKAFRQSNKEFLDRTANPDEAGDVKGTDLDDIFDGATGGTEEGTFQATPEAIANTSIQTPQIGEGEVEDILQRPSQSQLQQDQEDNAGQGEAGEDEVENPFLGDEPTSVGGSVELDTYASNAPTSYTETRPLVRLTAENPQASSAEGIEQGGTRTLAGERQIPDRTLDLDSAEADTPGKYELDTFKSNVDPDFEPDLAPDTTGYVRPPEPTTKFSIDPEPDEPIQMGEIGEVDTAPADVGEYGKSIGEAVKTQTADTTTSTAGTSSESAIKAGEDTFEGFGEDAVETTAETGGELGAEIGFDTAVSAIPVLGEAAIIGTGLYEGIKGLVDLFEKKPKPPPKPKEIGGVLSGGNPLGFQGSGLSSKLASSIPVAENSLDSSGIVSF